jgi:hypothetical protein
VFIDLFYRISCLINSPSAAAPTIIVVIIAGMTVWPVMNVTGTTAIKKKGLRIDEIVPGRPLAELNLKIVAPGLRLPGRRLTIEGLQGTMITGGGVLMTAEGLIIILTDAGTNMIDAETTEDATRRRIASRRGLRGTRMGMAVGPVEWIVILGFRSLAKQ